MAGLDKLFAEVRGRSLLAHTTAAFEESALIDRIVVVLSGETLERGRELIAAQGFAKASVCLGGARRQDSARMGMEALGECDYVAVHDGGRPLVDGGLIARGIEAARVHGAAVPVVPLVDTVKEIAEDGTVVQTLDRARLRAVQTPQVFRYELLARAHAEVMEDVTDDAAMLEWLGISVATFEGSRRNLKVTTPDDLALVEWLLTNG